MVKKKPKARSIDPNPPEAPSTSRKPPKAARAAHEHDSDDGIEDGIGLTSPTYLGKTKWSDPDDPNDAEILDLIRSLGAEDGDENSESPLDVQTKNAKLTPTEREEISQWNRLRAIQLRLQYLRLQFYHRNTIHLGARPNVWANLLLTDWSLVGKAREDIPEVLRPTYRAIARWHQTAQWVQEAKEAARDCKLLDKSPVRAKLFIALEMVTSAARATGSPWVALSDESLDEDQRRRVPIQLVRRSLRYLDRGCRVHLLDAEASLTVLMKSILGSLPPPEGIEEKELRSIRDTIKKHVQISDEELERARALYKDRGGYTVKKDVIESVLTVGSDKAQAIKDLMRSEGLEKKPRRKPRRKPGNGPVTP